MGFVQDESMVRVDFFRPTGKWYMTMQLNMRGEYQTVDIRQAVLNSMIKSFGEARALGYLDRYITVVLEPNHIHAIPVVFLPKGK